MTLIFIRVLSLIVIILPARFVFAQTNPSPTPESTSTNANVVQANIHSTIMNEDRSVIIHLPRNYSKETQKYAVMYVLDGTSQDDHTAEKAGILADAGLLPPVIVVGLPNTRGNRDRDQTPPYMRRNVEDENSAFGGGDKFLSFIEKELIPYIEGNYRTSDSRALTGNSRGGLFVLYALMEKPQLFQAWFCYSSPVWRFGNLMNNKMDQFLRDNPNMNGFLYFSVGEKETDQIRGGFTNLIEVLKRRKRKQFKWVAYSTPYVDHQENARVSTSKGLFEWGKYLKETRQFVGR